MASRRPNGSDQIPGRSLRVPEGRWARAKAVATAEERTLSDVINEFLEQYGKAAKS